MHLAHPTHSHPHPSPHSYVYPTHSLTHAHSLTPLAHAPTHSTSLTHALTHPPTHTCPLTHSTHSCFHLPLSHMRPPTPLANALTSPPADSFMHSLTHSTPPTHTFTPPPLLYESLTRCDCVSSGVFENMGLTYIISSSLVFSFVYSLSVKTESQFFHSFYPALLSNKLFF